MIRDLHSVVSWIFILANGLVGLWALAAHQWPKYRHRAGWIAVIVAEVVVLAQVVIGVILQVNEEIDGDRHQLYGFSAFASVGIIYAYRNEIKDKPHLLYGLGSLWLMGLGIRAAVL
ncbi:MAG: hypothetical protein P8J50_09080 [Acidimicrobiales bacterium]|nr:hypothetical protein [Acidimicrobiales bacterium]